MHQHVGIPITKFEFLDEKITDLAVLCQTAVLDQEGEFIQGFAGFGFDVFNLGITGFVQC